jgi:phosphatidylinositol alpha-1,6-mannosyltransferase
MRLLLITNDYLPRAGGIQQYLGNLVERYEGEVRVLAPRDRGARDDPRVRRSRWRFMWPTPRVRRWVEAQAAEFEPDFVLFGAPYPLPTLGPQLRQALGAPYGVVVHGAELTIPAAFPITRQLIAGPLRRADVVFANSHWTAGAVKRSTRREAAYLGIGVDLDLFHPPTASWGAETIVGTVSRFIPRKKLDGVLTVADRLYRQGHPLRVKVVGRGRLESRLRRLAGRLQVPVDFHVNIPWSELPARYREMDIFAVPCRSRWLGLEQEGLGIVFLEAAASGLPVIAGHSGGAPETVLPGTTGFVVHDEETLQEALELLLSDPERAASMGARGRRLMDDRYTWAAVMERLRSGMEQAVKEAR